MKIAIGATLHKKINKDSNGGTEVFAYELVKGLVKRGHEVTTFASSDSSLEGKLEPIVSEEEVNKMEQNQRLFYGYQIWESAKIVAAAEQFDVIHINYFEPFLFAPLSTLIKKPLIYTIHSDLLVSPAWQKALQSMVKPQDLFVFVSKSQASFASLINNKTYIYNGMDVSSFPYSDSHDNYLFWLGRVREKKGIKDVVALGVKTGEKVFLSGVIENTEGQNFFDTQIRSIIDDHKNIFFVGPSTFEQKVDLYKKAKAFVVPVEWEEPFGLVLIEAMATGTPVIAYARGAIPEIVVDGVTGYIVNSSPEDIRGKYLTQATGVDGLVEALGRVNSMSEVDYKKMRENCRKHVEENFTVDKMVEAYEKLYSDIMRQSQS